MTDFDKITIILLMGLSPFPAIYVRKLMYDKVTRKGKSRMKKILMRTFEGAWPGLVTGAALGFSSFTGYSVVEWSIAYAMVFLGLTFYVALQWLKNNEIKA